MVEQGQEREDKYDVPATWVLPVLADLLPPGGRWETADLALDNTYFDTPSGHLTAATVTLRRREGGPDAGWQLKVPQGEHRNEITAPDAPTLPDELAEVVVGLRAGEELKPIAKLTVSRIVHRLITEDGRMAAEIADDRVSAATIGDASRLSSWREVEVELKPAGSPRLLKVIGKRLRSAGAKPSKSKSKLRRALGIDDQKPTTRPGTIGALVADYLADQINEIVRHDLGLRVGEPEVHKFRVAIRRIRSTVRVYAPVLDAERVAALEPELVWLAGLLGEVRDRDILRARLTGQVADLPPELVLGPVAARIEETLLLERNEHLGLVREALDSERYAALVAQLLGWLTTPPLIKKARKPASTAAVYVEQAGRQVRKRLNRAGGDVDALHRARKAAKRYRYAAELSGPAGGRSAAKIVKTSKHLQTQLGEHQDSVVSAAFLRRIGAAAGAGEGQNGFTYGLLLAQEWQRADQIRAIVAASSDRKPRTGKKG